VIQGNHQQGLIRAVISVNLFSHLSLDQQNTIAYLRSPEAIRDRCRHLFRLACEDQLDHFCCDLSRLDQVAQYVIKVMEENYPSFEIPVHSRWRHFEVGGMSRLKELDLQLMAESALDRARIKFDLAIVSVLLDAGAGADWAYLEPQSQQLFRRSEGLAVASFRMFCAGTFSSDPDCPLQVDAVGLQRLSQETLAAGFQVSSTNPLVGLEGRLWLLHRLGQVLHGHPDVFAKPLPRPGHLVDYLYPQIQGNQLPARQILIAVLNSLGDIWPSRTQLFGVNLGDVWPHPALADDQRGGQLIPFHKLSQWLTYSLLEPLQDLGIQITNLDDLTGLPEYRNGGLCLDLGLLYPKHQRITHQLHRPDSTVIVEWRSLTVILLDCIADAIRQILKMTPAQLPLAKVLQGGTWTAGRKIAASLRPSGISPIQLESDGTVF
jgi:hypothetical protein